VTVGSAPGSGTIRALALSLKAIGLWFGFVALAALVSEVRVAALLPLLGEQRAHQVATVATAALVWIGIAVFARVTALAPREAVRVGLLWFAMSVVAEFVLLHYWFGISWSRLVADYDVRRGRLFALVLLTELLGPSLVVLSARRQRS
jgi:hypothetical protein